VYSSSWRGLHPARALSRTSSQNNDTTSSHSSPPNSLGLPLLTSQSQDPAQYCDGVPTMISATTPFPKPISCQPLDFWLSAEEDCSSYTNILESTLTGSKDSRPSHESHGAVRSISGRFIVTLAVPRLEIIIPLVPDRSSPRCSLFKNRR
jgi:hypothetical protein